MKQKEYVYYDKVRNKFLILNEAQQFIFSNTLQFKILSIGVFSDLTYIFMGEL
jgi:hypothetical protein